MSLEPDMRLDLRGKRCPFTVLDLAVAVRNLAAGGTLEILVDGSAGAEEVRAWCEATGREFIEPEGIDTGRVFLRRS
jgi:cysteine desulfurase